MTNNTCIRMSSTQNFSLLSVNSSFFVPSDKEGADTDPYIL